MFLKPLIAANGIRFALLISLILSTLMQRYFYRTPLIYLFFFTSFLAISCGADDKIDVSKIKLEIKIDRFDQALNKLNSANFSSEIPRLKEDYGDFYEDYVSQMLGIGTSSDTAYYAILRDVLSNIDYMALNSEITQVFPNLSTKEQELTDAFKHILYFYPEQKVPRLISFVSGFTVQTPIGNNYIGIEVFPLIFRGGSRPKILHRV
jgi:hypothetical protein